MINGIRIRQAREIRRLSQTELASNIGVHQPRLSQLESGLAMATSAEVEAIALRTGFPISFFRQESIVEFPEGSLLFRARANMSARERDSAFQFGRLMYEIAEKMEQHVTRIPVQLPRLNGNPVEAARVTRNAFRLSPDTPIQNLVDIVERNGVLVLVLPEPLPKHDAYSLWTATEPPRPVIVISGRSTGDRLRYNVAHEVGHLVLHASPTGDLKSFEKDAYLFAGEFLMPASAARQEIVPPVTLSTLAKLKPKWRISIQALGYRAKDLGIITDRQYAYLMQQLSALMGTRTREPEHLDVPVEKPRAFRKMAELIYGSPLDYKGIADDMCISVQTARDIFEAYNERYYVANTFHPQGTSRVLEFPRRRR